MRYRRNSLKRNSELGRKLAKARWAKDRARRDAEEPARLRELELARTLSHRTPPTTHDRLPPC